MEENVIEYTLLLTEQGLWVIQVTFDGEVAGVLPFELEDVEVIRNCLNAAENYTGEEDGIPLGNIGRPNQTVN